MTKGYGQFCPVAKAAEVFAERWTPLLLRDLLFGGGLRFGELHSGVPRMSRALLAERLDRLEREGLVERRRPPRGRGWIYHLTAAGEELGPVIELLAEWGQRWRTRDLRPEDRDPDLLMTAIQGRVQRERLPAQRVVVEFAFRDVGGRRWWLAVKRPEADLCRKDPGFEPDIHLITDTATLTQVLLGHLRLEQAVDDGKLELYGAADLIRTLPQWMARSPFAHHARGAPAAAAQ